MQKWRQQLAGRKLWKNRPWKMQCCETVERIMDILQHYQQRLGVDNAACMGRVRRDSWDRGGLVPRYGASAIQLGTYARAGRVIWTSLVCNAAC